MNKQTITLMFLAALIAMAAGLWLGQNDDQPSIKPEAIQGAIYPVAKSLKDFELLDQHSNKVTKKLFKNQWSLIFVGYTHCPDVCPTTLNVLNQVDGFMREQKIQPPQMIFLSIDPQRDTPAVMKPYVEYFNKDFTGLTGEVDEIKQLTQQLNAVYRKAVGASGDIKNDDYLMDHSSALMLVNPNGDLQSILTAPHTPANIIDSILKTRAYVEANKK